LLVIPAKAGIQFFVNLRRELDCGFRRDDELLKQSFRA
jgi:hypothetical protein